jgi:hypothetical protein
MIEFTDFLGMIKQKRTIKNLSLQTLMFNEVRALTSLSATGRAVTFTTLMCIITMNCAPLVSHTYLQQSDR